MGTIKRTLTLTAAAAVSVAGLMASAAPAAHAEYSCYFSQTRHVTYNDYCYRGSRHWIDAYYSGGWHRVYGGLAYSYATSTVPCYVTEGSYGTRVYY